MSLPYGYQLYGFWGAAENFPYQTDEIIKKIFETIEGLGLKIRGFRSVSGERIYLQVFHPHRALDIEELKEVKSFYPTYMDTCAYGFQAEVEQPDSGKWVLEYESRSNAVTQADDILTSVPEESDRWPSQTEIDLAVAAAELNEHYSDRGEQINKMQVDAAVRNAERVMKLRESGKFRILSVDTWDYGDGELVYEFETEEDALMFILLDRQLDQASQQGDSRFAKELYKKCGDLKCGKTSAQTLEPGVTAEQLRKRLKGWHRITSEVMYLYNPNGDLIGTYPT